MADEPTWIKGAELQKIMEKPFLLTPALGSLRHKPDCCRKEQVVGRGRGSSPDWEISPDTVQLLIDRGNGTSVRKGNGIVLRRDDATSAFLRKYNLRG